MKKKSAQYYADAIIELLKPENLQRLRTDDPLLFNWVTAFKKESDNALAAAQEQSAIMLTEAKLQKTQ